MPAEDDITREQARLLRRTIAPWINDQDTAGGIEVKLARARPIAAVERSGTPTFLQD